jgi:hypothetical protein
MNDVTVVNNPMTHEEKMALMARWHQAKIAVEGFKSQIEEERDLRKQVIENLFESPKEGTNKCDLPQGWSLKLTYKIDRKIDEAALPAIKAKLTEMGVNSDVLVTYKPELATKEYKALQTLNEAAAKVFDEAITQKPGSHTIELVPPKESFADVALKNQEQM